VRIACPLLAGLAVVSCLGCGRQRQTATVASAPESQPSKEPPFVVVDKPPPASAERKLAIWDDRLWLMTGDRRYAWPLPIGGRIIARTREVQVVARSPDRTRIAYLQESSEGGSLHGPSGTVWIIGTEEGRPSQLTDLREVGMIVWSPDGRFLAASGTHRFVGPPAEASKGEGEEASAEHDLVAHVDVGLWLIDVEKNSAKLLYHAHTGNGDVGTYFGLCWSPDSHTIAAINYGASCEDDLGPRVTLANVETGKLRECGRDRRDFPKWLRERLPSEDPDTAAQTTDQEIIDLDTEEPSGA